MRKNTIEFWLYNSLYFFKLLFDLFFFSFILQGNLLETFKLLLHIFLISIFMLEQRDRILELVNLISEFLKLQILCLDFLLQHCHWLGLLMSAVDEWQLAEVKIPHWMRALFFSDDFFLFEKRMGQDLFYWGSLFGVRTKQSSYKVLWVLWKTVRKSHLVINDVAFYYSFCKPGIINVIWWGKWGLANQHLIQEHSQGPEIQRLIMKVSFDHFRCQVIRCAAVCVSDLVCRLQIWPSKITEF